MSRNEGNGENGEKSPEGWRYPEQPLSKGPFAIFGNNLAIVRYFCLTLCFVTANACISGHIPGF